MAGLGFEKKALTFMRGGPDQFHVPLLLGARSGPPQYRSPVFTQSSSRVCAHTMRYDRNNKHEGHEKEAKLPIAHDRITNRSNKAYLSRKKTQFLRSYLL